MDRVERYLELEALSNSLQERETEHLSYRRYGSAERARAARRQAEEEMLELERVMTPEELLEVERRLSSN